MAIRNFTALICCTILLFGCRGTISRQPPIHPNPNMDFQNRFDPQERNAFFENKRSMRLPVAGTVARGRLRLDMAYYEGLNPDSTYIDQIPSEITVDRAFLERGQNRYNVYCTPCHGHLGNGDGIISAGGYWPIPVPSYHTERLRSVADGYIFNVISDGIRTMPGYSHQINVRDRWAIVAYVRALQRSQHVPQENLPEDALARIKQ